MEQMIVFVYDTGYCQHEADDPQKAVLYFHPSWVSDQQRLALCGQLMGATHFCTSLFSAPSVLTLQSGKFVLKKTGRYVVSVGSDQSLAGWILKDRFSALQSMIELYHKDLDTILESVDRDHDAFIRKLTEILDLFIPILQCVVNSVGSVPSIQYTNSNSAVFLESLQLLEACTSNKGVAGGCVLHNGRVVVSQLESNINQLAALTDPYRVKNCAKSIPVPFHLPVGVQLLQVFVQKCQLQLLQQNVQDETEVKSVANRRTEAKRDIAKIFTVHEEEESWSSGIDMTTDSAPRQSSYVKLKHRRNSKYKSESNILKERSKNYKANPNISVCSTPTVEKKLIHEEILSICSGKIDTKVANPSVPDLVQDVLNSKPEKPIKSLRRMSMDDQMVDFSHTAFPIPLRYYSFGLPRLCKPEIEKAKGLYKSKWYKTLADPLYPVFREDGLPVSKGLYNHCLDEHYKDYLAANKAIDCQEEFLKSKKTTIVKPPEKKKEPEPVPKKIDQKLFRRTLTLPIKPMTLDGGINPPPTKAKTLQAITPSTPLMAKLSLLALEENQEVEVNKRREEEERRGVERRERRMKEEKIAKEAEQKRDSTLLPCTLFVCGHGNMTLLLLLTEGTEQDPDLVLLLWEAAMRNLDHIENLWNRNSDLIQQHNGSSSYSFISLDPAWGTVRKQGPWGNDELKIVGSLHQDLAKAGNITELIVRSEDSVVYGYRCGKIETFYQQAAASSIGLPTPADLMGVITLKARRRLERDHGILLL